MGKEDRFYVTRKQIESEPVHGCGWWWEKYP